jgi:hypothetical protein
MALQIRRGTEAERVTMSPPLVEGELAYVTNYESAEVSPLWIGDGDTAGGIPIAPVLAVNSKVGTVELYTDDITEDGATPTNKWFTEDRAQDAAASLFTTSTTSSTAHSGISFAYNDADGKIVATVPTSVNSGTANALAYYSSTGAVVSGSNSNLTWNNSTSVLTVENSTVQIFANNGPRSVLNLSSSYNSSTSNSLTMSRSRGDRITPTALVNGDSLGNLQFSGYDGTTYVPAARISGFLTKAVSTGILPSGVGISTMNSTGDVIINLRVLDTGQTIIGPGISTDLGTGQLAIVSTVNPQTAFFNNSVFSINTIFDGADGQNFSIARSRGTRATSTTVVTGDDIIDFTFAGYDGTANTTAAQITAGVEGTISTGKVPGNLIFRTANTNGVVTQVLKISTPSTSTTVGQLTVSGTIATASTPATFWNYDSSASTLTLTSGDTVNFSSFSGSVLVNCYLSGTVTQYLCGGTGGATAIGSSKVTPTGTMADNSGINGYTFTATETGIHSFYVIRTRAGA